MFDFNIIGLNGRDKRVYEALLQLPHASVRTIAEHVNINRGSVHESLLSLQKAGIVGYAIYGKRQRYIAHPPQVLHELIDEKRRALSISHSNVEEYAQSLRDKQHTETIPFATNYEDIEGLASILRDVISTLKISTDKTYRVISSADLHEYLYHNFRNYTNERIKNNISVKVIAHEKGAPISEHDLAERRVLPSRQLRVPRCYTIIYAHKTAFIALSDTNVPSGIVIENHDITKLQIELFETLWKELK
ncbi:hypothetical protein A2707_05830 [Candidatus Saccharibacteria bacterium RIFCSPHIGHO2_01_FULL_45_15]|nr:MAG: hypothetical protein A2707_05830 [Candidatus Saccharibacteria bacterium RIFCSPHIGHO2_01_FULL_45_15]OGL28965.1 MAG: hypothetical protein A3C39_06050 [Candidatus Saccharibacteria bacterium RIFCSPHIGHO2_02_FULL_46_12]OGL31979.1 MAG: hypothetical protein A3E76_01775 [Candidatus Saccharibacteria bacterium RIFCSPHIGHO2_12_FULL_44_22]